MSDCSKTSVGCSGCGQCCTPVYLSFGPADITARLANPKIGGRWRRDLEFFRAHWWPTGTVTRGSRNGKWNWQYACAKYDIDTHACTAYADRPLVCAQHPIYPFISLKAALESLESNQTPACSYRALGKARLVIVEVNGRAA